MEEEVKHKKIELRSEEVQEVMNRVPSWILRCGLTVLLCIILILLIGSYWFKYPDVITSEITISTQQPPAYILARTSGRIDTLYVANGQVVSKGTNLGVIENTADAGDILELQDQLEEWKQEGYTLASGKRIFDFSMTEKRNLGEVQAAYGGFISMLSEAIRISELGYYTQKQTAQKSLITIQEKYYAQVKKQCSLAEKEHAIAHSMYKRDSTLFNLNAMNITEFEESGRSYLQSTNSKETYSMQLTQTAIQIEQSKELLLDLEKQALEEEQTQIVNLKNSVEQLMAQINTWEQRYLLKTPVEGKVTLMSVWNQNQNVETGNTVFVVAPVKPSIPLGKALLPVQGSGKVKVGQSVNIRLNNYPDQEFGYVKGKVSYVSPVPTAEDMYVVDISLPDGLQTSYDKVLPVTREMKGSADIITENLRLIERIFLPLKQIWATQNE